MLLLTLCWILASCLAQAQPQRQTDHGDDCSLVVSTPSGKYAGLIDGSTPLVRQWRSIPYALPPVGERRFMPPVPVSSNHTPASNYNSRAYDSTSYPPQCAQFLFSEPSIWDTLVPQFFIDTPGQNKTAGQYAHSSAEDCLYLGVWAPTARHGQEKLPVVMFMTGGAFANGGVAVPYQNPAPWVQRSKSHIVVTINYRMGIVGFPGAAGLTDNNVGFLDQRAALEWVRTNIAAFGGDPDKITLWGQSAGSISAEFHSFVNLDDPIARAYIMTSGSFGSGFTLPSEKRGVAFSATASALNCINASSFAAELECMRAVPIERLVTAASLTGGIRAFLPLQDNVTIFSDYAALYEQGRFSPMPAIYSFCSNDGTGVLPYASSPKAVNVTAEADITKTWFICPAAQSCRLRGKYTPSIYRYESQANFSNVSPVPWLGAYHFSDLAYIFGTDDEFRSRSTAYEIQVSEAMQDMMLAFITDPENVPGWPRYDSGQMLRFGAASGPAKQVIAQAKVDGGCAACGPDSIFYEGQCA